MRDATEPQREPTPAWFERAAFWISIASCLLLTAFTLAEIAARPLGVQIHVGGEFNGMLMGWLIFFALPVVTRARQHLIVDFFQGMMAPGLRRVVSWIGALLMPVYVAALLYFCAKLALASWNNAIMTQGVLRTPVIYPQAGMVLGLALMWISSLLVFFEECRRLFGRAPAPPASTTEARP